MKLTWREQEDGTWTARYFPPSGGPLPKPYSLSVIRTEGGTDGGWRWDVRRDAPGAQHFANGSGNTEEEAMFAAHASLARTLRSLQDGGAEQDGEEDDEAPSRLLDPFG